MQLEPPPNMPKYNNTIGDPCYRYNKQAKEHFFRNVYLAYLFLFFAAYDSKHFVAKKSQKNSLTQGAGSAY